MHLKLSQRWIAMGRNLIVRVLHVCVWTCKYPFETVGYVIQWEVRCWAGSVEMETEQPGRYCSLTAECGPQTRFMKSNWGKLFCPCCNQDLASELRLFTLSIQPKVTTEQSY